MKNMILITIIVLMAACSKPNGGYQFIGPNGLPEDKNSIRVVYDVSGPEMGGLEYLTHEFAEESLYTEVWITGHYTITDIGYTDIGSCLSDNGIKGMRYSFNANRVAFYFVTNTHQEVSYNDLIGCEFSLNVRFN